MKSKDFAAALSLLDDVCIVDIYPAREAPIPGVTSKLIYDNLKPGIKREMCSKDGILDVDATIYCEKASHKGIIIGKGGQMLKKISSQARADCERFMGTKVYLQTWIKVKENWRDSDFLIRNFGYRRDQ